MHFIVSILVKHWGKKVIKRKCFLYTEFEKHKMWCSVPVKIWYLLGRARASLFDRVNFEARCENWKPANVRLPQGTAPRTEASASNTLFSRLTPRPACSACVCYGDLCSSAHQIQLFPPINMRVYILNLNNYMISFNMSAFSWRRHGNMFVFSFSIN